MADGGLTAQPLGPRGGLNWVFLVELLVCGVLGLFFLFYFNRLFATIISYIIRAYTWRRYKAYVDITSLQISLLGGRLFFKTLRYQAHNETILVHDGRITWRYWLGKVQEADVYRSTPRSERRGTAGRNDSQSDGGSTQSESSEAEHGRIKPHTDLPCRFHIRVSGVEAFLYNHSPSYDHILSELEAVKAQKERERQQHKSPRPSNPQSGSTPGEKTPSNEYHEHDLRQQNTASDHDDPSLPRRNAKHSLPAYLRLFPIQVECKKAAAAVGNENTRSVIVAKAASANGRIDAGQAGPLDIFKLLFLFSLDNVSVTMRQNPDFKELQLQAATRTENEDGVKSRSKRFPILTRVSSIIADIRTLFSWKRSSSSSIRTSHVHEKSQDIAMQERLMAKQPWHGLSRFLDDQEKAANNEWDHNEYARVSSLADFVQVGLVFFWDIAGPVRHIGAENSPPSTDPNGAEPPAYGLELTVKDGTVNYGPWTDRERIILQAVFFPASLVDARPFPGLDPGQPRVSTIFSMTFYVEGNVTLRIPVRESSKDWRWQSKAPSSEADEVKGPFRRKGQVHGAGKKRSTKARTDSSKDKRPFGWLDVTVAQDTVVHYDMDMYAKADGFHNALDVHLKEPRITTSVNHDLLWKSGDIAVKGNLSNPLAWNTLRTWTFTILVDDLDLFILRDHMFLLTDVITDWTAGPTSNFFTFVPFRYKLDVQFRNFSLFLGANDANLINRPTDLDDNSFLVLRGESLRVDFAIPIEYYRPPLNTFTFETVAENLALDLRNPTRLTLNELLKNKRVGTLPLLTLNGSHTAYSDQSPELTDTLQMEIWTKDLCLTVFGYLLRYFVNFKDNYFGEFLHFRTFEEYQANSGDTASAIREEREKYKFRRSNDLDVILSISVERPTLLLPVNLYSADCYIRADLPMADVDLRVTNYYLDLQVDVSPMSFSYFDGGDAEEATPSGEQLRIDSVTVTGHRLFGLPPAEPAYVSTWDISAGNICGKCVPKFLHQAAQAGQAFIFALDDHENSLPDVGAVTIHDMMYLNLTTGSFELTLDIDDCTMYLAFDPIELHFDDAADRNFSSRLSTRIPNLTLACVQKRRHAERNGHGTDITNDRITLFVQTTVDFTLLTRKKNFSKTRVLQQRHVRKHDQRTNRVQFLLDDDPRKLSVDSDDLPIYPPALSLAPFPCSIRSHGHDRTSRNSLGLASQSCRQPQRSGLPSTANETVTSAYFMPILSASLPSEIFSELPNYASHDMDDSTRATDHDTILYDPGTTEEDEEHHNIILSFVPGIRALVRPEFASTATKLATDFIPSEIDDVIDAVQLSVISKVESQLKRRLGEKSVVDMRITLPSFVLRFLVDPDAQLPTIHNSHRLDVSLNRLSLAFRARSCIGDLAGDTINVLHSTLDTLSVEFSADLAHGSSATPDVRLEINDVFVWFVLSTTNTLKLSFKVLTTSIAMERSQQLTLGIMQVAEVGKAVTQDFMVLDSTLNLRTCTLLQYIRDHHSGVADPLYLSRMTYVLRAFPEHLRNQDSWKMLARIRHALFTLSEDQINHLSLSLLDTRSVQSENQSSVEDIIDWCSWDIPAPRESCLYRMIMGEAETLIEITTRKPLQLAVQSGLLRILAGTSNRGSEISMADLNIDMTVSPPSEPTGLMLVEENLRTLITLATRSSELFVRLKWDLLTGVKSALDVFEWHRGSREVTSPSKISVQLKSPEEPTTRDDLHFVFSTETATAIVDTIHLQHVSEVKDVQLSLIGTSRARHTYGNCMGALLACERATTELHTQGDDGARIWRTELSNPSIYVDTRHRLHADVTELNIGGSYQDVSIKVQQEPIGILSTIGRVLSEEVLQVRELQEKISKLRRSTTSTTDAIPDLRKIEINAALLAGTFNISFAVLQSLSLNFRGKVANLRIKPRRQKDGPLDLEVDVGPIRFAAMSKESGLAGEEALFHTPRIDTSAEIYLGDEQNKLKLSGTVNEMRIEASALQNILTLFRRQEVQATIRTLQAGFSDLQRRMNAIFPQFDQDLSEDTTREEPSLVYSVDLILAGFNVVATAPVKEVDANKAELIFGLGLVQLVVDNATDSEGPSNNHSFPEVYARIDSIFATLDLLGTEQRRRCGHIQVGLMLQSKFPPPGAKSLLGDIHMNSDSLDVEVTAETASTIVDIITHIQKRIVDLDLSKEVEYMKKLRQARRKSTRWQLRQQESDESFTLETLASLAPSNLVISLNHIRFAWIIASHQKGTTWQPEDLELSLARVEFSLRQRNQAKLTIESLQLQMIPKAYPQTKRTMNSALLPEMILMVMFSTSEHGLSLAFQAVGQAVDCRLDSSFAGPLGLLIASGSHALEKYRAASKNWYVSSKTESSSPVKKTPFGTRHITSLLVDVSFAGGILYLRGKPISLPAANEATNHPQREQGRTASSVQTTLRAPGIAMKLEYISKEQASKESTLTGEMKVDASSNTVYPELVPIILQITEHAKGAMQKAEATSKNNKDIKKSQDDLSRSGISLPDDNLLKSNELLARTKISFGLRICRQEFGLSCQPIARVDAKVQIDDIYITFNTLDPRPDERFLAISASLRRFQASVQHVYSKDSTFSFDIDAINLSVMNSKHIDNSSSGLSAILRIEPMRTTVNARQLQDLLLFREIWLPEQLRKNDEPQTPAPVDHPDELLVQRYRQVAAAAAFPWNATVSLTDVSVEIDFGQSIGKSSINIKDMWASSQKTSGWKQELCVGIENIDAKSVGRMGGFIELADIKLRTLIEWPIEEARVHQTPLIQATLGFEKLRVKAAFDYQPFAFADLGGLSFIMYNVREQPELGNDRLVAALDLNHAYAYFTASSPAQSLGLYQAFDRLIQEKQAAFQQSIVDIQKQLQRPSISSPYTIQTLQPLLKSTEKSKDTNFPIKLRTDVVVRVQTINVGVYPSTFFDSQILKLEAVGGEARFLVDITTDGKIHSNLSLMLGQLQVALASTKRIKIPQTISDVRIEEVIENGIAAKGGIILRVPRLVASMQTWQPPEAKLIDYIFKSTFEGKVDVGWNYSRISFIRTMWNTHTRSLAARLGKPLPEPAVRITAGPDRKPSDTGCMNEDARDPNEADKGKITAVVSMPVSKYTYRALEPPIIETPQLRDMGEATPPLEWIGLQRDKLPNVVHQVVIVSLLELAKEVEDAYGGILGSS